MPEVMMKKAIRKYKRDFSKRWHSIEVILPHNMMTRAFSMSPCYMLSRRRIISINHLLGGSSNKEINKETSTFNRLRKESFR